MGSVRCSTYLSYINSAGLVTSMLIFILFVGGQVLALLADISLESWSSSATNQQEVKQPLLSAISLLYIAATVAGIARAVLILWAQSLNRGSRKGTSCCYSLTNGLFTSNPVARINVFGRSRKHDEQLQFYSALESLLPVSAVLLAVLAPLMAIPVLPWSWCCGGCDGIFAIES